MDVHMYIYTYTYINTYPCINCSALSHKEHVLMYQFWVIKIAFLNYVIYPTKNYLRNLFMW